MTPQPVPLKRQGAFDDWTSRRTEPAWTGCCSGRHADIGESPAAMAAA